MPPIMSDGKQGGYKKGSISRMSQANRLLSGVLRMWADAKIEGHVDLLSTSWGMELDLSVP